MGEVHVDALTQALVERLNPVLPAQTHIEAQGAEAAQPTSREIRTAPCSRSAARPATTTTSPTATAPSSPSSTQPATSKTASSTTRSGSRPPRRSTSPTRSASPAAGRTPSTSSGSATTTSASAAGRNKTRSLTRVGHQRRRSRPDRDLRPRRRRISYDLGPARPKPLPDPPARHASLSADPEPRPVRGLLRQNLRRDRDTLTRRAVRLQDDHVRNGRLANRRRRPVAAGVA